MRQTIRIGHLADSHLKDARYGNIRSGEDFYRGLAAAIEASAKEVDVFVHVGDVFDAARPGPRVIGQLMKIDDLLCRLGKRMYAVTGNHDWNPTPWLDVLFPATRDSGIYPLDGRTTKFMGWSIAGVKPYNPVRFMELRDETADFVRGADVVLYHGFVEGLTPLFSGDKFTISTSDLPLQNGNKAWLLGDIHIQSYTQVGSCLIGYPGSTEVVSASEATSKSVPVVELSEDGAKVVATIPFETRPFFRAEVDTDDEMDRFLSTAKELMPSNPVLHFRYCRDLPSALQRLYAAIDPMKCLLRVECAPSKVSLLPAETAGSVTDITLADFFRAYFQEGDADVAAVALDVLARPTEVVGIVNHYVDEYKTSRAKELRDN